jgi:2-polyprenyl-3-methyl-5-hydroxy-6-metoxy-1,4-benzoquinol methylase
MSEYVYNYDDVSTAALDAQFSNRIGDGSGDHEAEYLNALKLLAAAQGSGSMVDIGCGVGRCTEITAALMAEVVALEPDEIRSNLTRENVKNLDNVTVCNQMSFEYIAENPGKCFDLVLLGMVLQHVSTRTCASLMNDVAQLTKPGGIAMVSTTNVPENASYFSKQKSGKGRLKAQISEEEFNEYAENSAAQDLGLPVRRFSRSDLESVVPECFDIVHWSQFSYYRPEALKRFSWLHSLKEEELADTGMSQYIVLRKKV